MCKKTMTRREALTVLQELVDALDLPGSYNVKYAPSLIGRFREELGPAVRAISARVHIDDIEGDDLG